MNMHVAVPGNPQDSRARRLATQERERQKSLQRLSLLRREAKAEIDRLIAFLDATDTYVQTECEANGDEADQSYREGWSAADCPMEDDEDDGLDEPSLAAPENHPSCWTAGGSQAHWAAGNRDEREGDDCADDREGDELLHGGEAAREDDEPSLGWTDDEAARGEFYAGSFGRIDMELH